MRYTERQPVRPKSNAGPRADQLIPDMHFIHSMAENDRREAKIEVIGKVVRLANSVLAEENFD